MKPSYSGGGVEVQYSYVDGAHFFTSWQVKGLCAASRDLRAAYHAVSGQLSALVRDDAGRPVAFKSSVPVEKFEEWLVAHCPNPVPELKSRASAKWALENETKTPTTSG